MWASLGLSLMTIGIMLMIGVAIALLVTWIKRSNARRAQQALTDQLRGRNVI